MALLEDADDNDDMLLDDHTVVDMKTITNSSADNKISRLKSQVAGVVEDMKINIDKVVDRGTNLNELNDRSEQLGVTADTFSKRSRGLKRTMYFRTCRQRLYLSLTVGFILILFICKCYLILIEFT